MLLVLFAAINSNYGMPPSRLFISISCLFLCWAYMGSREIEGLTVKFCCMFHVNEIFSEIDTPTSNVQILQ